MKNLPIPQSTLREQIAIWSKRIVNIRNLSNSEYQEGLIDAIQDCIDDIQSLIDYGEQEKEPRKNEEFTSIEIIKIEKPIS